LLPHQHKKYEFTPSHPLASSQKLIAFVSRLMKLISLAKQRMSKDIHNLISELRKRIVVKEMSIINFETPLTSH
jgi:hypothetical protein